MKIGKFEIRKNRSWTIVDESKTKEVVNKKTGEKEIKEDSESSHGCLKWCLQTISRTGEEIE